MKVKIERDLRRMLLKAEEERDVEKGHVKTTHAAYRKAVRETIDAQKQRDEARTERDELVSVVQEIYNADDRREMEQICQRVLPKYGVDV